MPTRYNITRISDANIIRFFLDVVDPEESVRPQVTILENVNVSIPGVDEPKSEIFGLFGSASYLIKEGHYNLPDPKNMRISFYRGRYWGLNSSGAEAWITNNPFVDSIEIKGPNIANGPESIRVAAAINSCINLAPPSGLADDGASALQQSAAILNQISSAAAEIAATTAGRHKELDRIEDRLKSEYARNIEMERSKIAAELSTELDKLKDREALLIEREADIDDRENTHVRREVRDKLISMTDGILREGLLKKSEQSFYVIVAVSLLVGFILAVGALLSGQYIVQSQENRALFFLEVTRILLGLGAGAAFWFAIRQSGLRYAQIYKWENELHRFRLDTERASLLLEGDLEARKVNDSGLPEIMLDRFSRGLFASDRENDSSDPVGNALMHLLNRPAALEVGTAGIKVEVDKSSLRKASKELEDR